MSEDVEGAYVWHCCPKKQGVVSGAAERYRAKVTRITMEQCVEDLVESGKTAAASRPPRHSGQASTYIIIAWP